MDRPRSFTLKLLGLALLSICAASLAFSITPAVGRWPGGMRPERFRAGRILRLTTRLIPEVLPAR